MPSLHLHSTIYLFNIYVLTSYCVPGTGLGTEDIQWRIRLPSLLLSWGWLPSGVDKIIKEANKYIMIGIQKSKTRLWLRELERDGGRLIGWEKRGKSSSGLVLVEIWMRSHVLIWRQVFQAEATSRTMAQRTGISLSYLNIGKTTNVAWAEWARRTMSRGEKSRVLNGPVGHGKNL